MISFENGEEEIGLDYEGPCPICGLFHYDFCTMKDVLEEGSELKG